MKKLLALFPGQGSQSVGMGKSYLESENEKIAQIADELFSKADKALGFSLRDICLSGPEEKLKETAITQPAILTVSVIGFKAFESQDSEPYEIVAGAGHSLGEYSALVAAGALSFEDAVLQVHKRGTYMQEAVPIGSGKMAAVLGSEIADIEDVLSRVEAVAEIANINAPGQVVVAGTAEGIDEMIAKFEGAKIKELPVSAPFHCSLMKPAAEKLGADLDNLSISEASFPIYANVTAEPVTNPEDIRACLKDQVCGRVRWVESMERAISQHSPEEGIEFGSGKVLAGLMKRINRELKVTNC